MSFVIAHMPKDDFNHAIAIAILMWCPTVAYQVHITITSYFATALFHLLIWSGNETCVPSKLHNDSLVPRLSRNANMYRVESLVSFVRKHDVSLIKIGQKQNGNVCALFNQLRFNARCVLFNA